MQFAICNEIFQGWDIGRAMQFAAQAGYHGIEIAPFTLGQYVTQISKERRSEVRNMARQAGIAITGIHWVLAQTEGLHMSHPNTEIRDKTADYLCEVVELCHDLGGNIIVLGSPKQRSVLEGVSYDQAWAWTKQTLTPAIMRALDRGVTLCLEPLSPAETNFINTAEEAIRFVKMFRSPSFKIILDVKAMSSEGKPIPQIIKESWPFFAYFHANDPNLKGPGFGSMDFVDIFGALNQTPYDGWVSVEVFNFDEGPEAIATRSIDYLKKSHAAAPPRHTWD